MERKTAGARYRELGEVLRIRREEAGLSCREIGRLVGWSASKVSRVETGQTAIDTVEAIHYLGHCGLYRAEVMDVLALCREAERRLGHWVSPHGEWVEDSLNSLIYHEATAAQSTTYEPLTVPGLLQTADYARVWCTRPRWLKPHEIDRDVSIRMLRQQILDVPRPARFKFYVHEQALRLMMGSPAIMHEQMLKLVLVATLDHVSIRVVPSLARDCSAFGGAFRLFEYAEYPPLVYLDTYKTGLFLEDKEYVDSFRELVPAISEVALDEGQSRVLIAALASEYDQRSERDAANRLEEEQL
jgi:transcriptional regulator with XRE-family HTH domain